MLSNKQALLYADQMLRLLYKAFSFFSQFCCDSSFFKILQKTCLMPRNFQSCCLKHFKELYLYSGYINNRIQSQPFLINHALSYDVVSGSEITPCKKIDILLLVYRLLRNIMTSITTYIMTKNFYGINEISK